MRPPTGSELRELLARPGLSAHLVGMGGIGMAGLARLLLARGIAVSGSEQQPNALCEALVREGVTLQAGHRPENLPATVDLMVRSTAIPATNPELIEAAARALPIFQRGQVLAALCRDRRSIAISGTHGKTSSSAMTAWCLRESGLPTGFFVGGESAQLGQVADDGAGEWWVVEADESDGTLVHYHPEAIVVTNIEFDHMEHFADEQEVLACFEQVTSQCRILIACIDDPQASALAERHRAVGGRVLTYGFSAAADFRGEDLRHEGLGCTYAVTQEGRLLGEVRLAFGGPHNALNALAAVAACVGVAEQPAESVLRALARFLPVGRRFEIVAQGGAVSVVNDYAHHPTEIRALLTMAQRWPAQRRIGIFQPHRYSRTRLLGEQFAPAFAGLDELILVPVYAASEKPQPGGTSADLLQRIRSEPSAPPCTLQPDLPAAWTYLQQCLQPGDLLLVIGAGDVSNLADWASEYYA